jgi:hypothetical protein
MLYRVQVVIVFFDDKANITRLMSDHASSKPVPHLSENNRMCNIQKVI